VKSLSVRIFLSFWLALLAIVAAAIGVTVLSLTSNELQPQERDAQVAEAASALARGGREGLVNWLRAKGQQEQSASIMIIDESGHELLGRQFGRRSPGRRIRAGRGSIAIEGVQVRGPEPFPLLVGRNGETYRLAMLRPRPDRFGLRALLEARVWITLIALAITALVSWILARSITRPIDDLTNAVQNFASGSLDGAPSRRTLGRRDELGRLARDFATMGARIRELLASRERLLRDVSHELRSPLARIRLALGLARQPGSNVDQQLTRLEHNTERLDALIGQILSVTRLGAGDEALRRTETDVAALVSGIARDADFEARAVGKRVRLLSPTNGLSLRIDATWMASAIENAVRNAVRHTAVATEVTVSLETSPGSVTVRVADHGPGVPETELKNIFEPFHRVVDARDRNSGGEGLGLAITARVVAAHGGTAAARNAPDGGLIVELVLPRLWSDDST